MSFLTAFARGTAPAAVTFNAASHPAQLANPPAAGVTRALAVSETYVLLAPGHTVGGPPFPRSLPAHCPDGLVNAGACPGKPLAVAGPGPPGADFLRCCRAGG